MKTHRTKIEIINKILDVILNIKNISINKFMIKANLSPQGYKYYKKELINKGFIKEIIMPKGNVNGRYHKKESKFFEITNKGREYLDFYKKFVAFKEKYDLNNWRLKDDFQM